MLLSSARPIAALELRIALREWDKALRLAETLAPEQVGYATLLTAKEPYERALLTANEPYGRAQLNEGAAARRAAAVAGLVLVTNRYVAAMASRRRIYACSTPSSCSRRRNISWLWSGTSRRCRCVTGCERVCVTDCNGSSCLSRGGILRGDRRWMWSCRQVSVSSRSLTRFLTRSTLNPKP